MNEIYLDNAATSKPCKECIDAINQGLNLHYHNPSSLYSPALVVSQCIDETKKIIANKLNANYANVYFTASGTDANNLAILSYAYKFKKDDVILYSQIEHPSVSECCLSLKNRGIVVDEISILNNGTLDIEKLKTQLSSRVKLICVMQVNNEIGIINNIAQIVRLRNEYAPNAFIHVDGVQGFLKVPFSFDEVNVNSYSISGHKIHGPKGIGALITNGKVSLPTYRFGGGQENGIISGTENTIGIFGLKAAVEIYGDNSTANYIFEIKTFFLDNLKKEIPNLIIVGPNPYDKTISAPHILNVAFPPLRSDVMLNALADKQIFCSSGSACASKKQKVSKVLKSMKIDRNISEYALRFSFSKFTTKEELQTAISEIKEIYNKYSKYVRR